MPSSWPDLRTGTLRDGSSWSRRADALALAARPRHPSDDQPGREPEPDRQGDHGPPDPRRRREDELRDELGELIAELEQAGERQPDRQQREGKPADTELWGRGGARQPGSAHRARRSPERRRSSIRSCGQPMPVARFARSHQPRSPMTSVRGGQVVRRERQREAQASSHHRAPEDRGRGPARRRIARTRRTTRARRPPSPPAEPISRLGQRQRSPRPGLEVQDRVDPPLVIAGRVEADPPATVRRDGADAVAELMDRNLRATTSCTTREQPSARWSTARSPAASTMDDVPGGQRHARAVE